MIAPRLGDSPQRNLHAIEKARLEHQHEELKLFSHALSQLQEFITHARHIIHDPSHAGYTCQEIKNTLFRILEYEQNMKEHAEMFEEHLIKSHKLEPFLSGSQVYDKEPLRSAYAKHHQPIEHCSSAAEHISSFFSVLNKFVSVSEASSVDEEVIDHQLRQLKFVDHKLAQIKNSYMTILLEMKK